MIEGEACDLINDGFVAEGIEGLVEALDDFGAFAGNIVFCVFHRVLVLLRVDDAAGVVWQVIAGKQSGEHILTSFAHPFVVSAQPLAVIHRLGVRIVSQGEAPQEIAVMALSLVRFGQGGSALWRGGVPLATGADFEDEAGVVEADGVVRFD